MPLHIISELIALCFGILFYRYLNKPFKWLCWFMFYIVLVEFGGLYITTILHRPNHKFFNITVPISFVFYFVLFWHIISGKILKDIISVMAIIFLIFSGFNLVFVQGFSFFNSYTMMLGSLLVIGACGMLLLELLNKTTADIMLWKLPEFWVVVGLLVSFSGTLLYWVLFNLNYDSYALYFRWMVKSQIYVRYLCIAISFLCFYKPRPLTPIS